MNRKILMFGIITLVIDQLTKVCATIFLDLNRSVKIIPNFFYLTLVHNEGAAWGLLSNHTWIIVVATIVARNNVAFGLLCGGLLGNLIDRVTSGYVIDFFDFYIFKYDYPVFNVADIAIVVGILLLIYAVFKGEDVNENNCGRKSGKIR